MVLALLVCWIAGPSGALSLMPDPSESRIIRKDAVFTASGEGLAAVASGGYDLVGSDAGKALLSTGQDFALSLDHDLEAGLYLLTILCSAPTTSTDSFWLEIDGQRIDAPIVLPRNAFGEAKSGFRLERTARTSVRLVLRERPGVVVAGLDLVHMTVEVDPDSVIRPDLAKAHPRLFITRTDLSALRQAQYSEAGQRLYRAPSILKGTPPPPEGPPKRAGWTWELDSQAMPCLLLGRLEVEDRLDAIRRHILAICEYDKWLPDGWSYSTSDLDLDAAYMLHGTAIAYDWLHAYFTEAERKIIREKLTHQARIMFEASLLHRMGWSRTVQQNHYWFDNYAIGVAACALYGEAPEAEMWLAWSWDRLHGTLMTFADDGGFHEGPAYWDFSVAALFRWIDLYEHTTGRTVQYADEWIRKAGTFPVHYVYPGLASAAAIEDSWRPGIIPKLSNLFWLAGRNRDPRLFRVGELIRPGQTDSRWWVLRALAKGVTPDEGVLDDLVPTLAYYPDVEMYFARTSWGPQATMFAFECRPLGGHTLARLIEAYPWIGGVGHNHPAQNSFVLFGGGKELVVDPGYTLNKETANHNTILVGEMGQYGDDERWPSWHPGWSHVEYASTDFPYVRGEAASAYPPEARLERFTRQMVMLDRERLIICDELKTEMPRRFTWLLHFDAAADVRQTGEDRFLETFGDARLRIDVLTPTGMAAQIDRYEPTWNNIARPTYHEMIGRLQLTTGLLSATPIVAVLSVNSLSERPTLTESPDLLVLTFDDSTRVGFNRTGGLVSLEGLQTDARALVISRPEDGGPRARAIDMRWYRDASGRRTRTVVQEGEFRLTEEGWVPEFQPANADPRSDFDGDGVVGFGDFVAFARAFGSSSDLPNWIPACDLDADGRVGFGDFVIFAASFGYIV